MSKYSSLWMSIVFDDSINYSLSWVDVDEVEDDVIVYRDRISGLFYIESILEGRGRIAR